MSFWTLFFWVILPYLALASMIIGIIWRWKVDKFGWTTRSSEMFEKKWLRISSPLFHYGILLVIAGHIVGLIIPESWTSAIGISEGIYHAMAVGLGMTAATMTILGAIGLLIRRFVVKSVRLATSRSDIVMYLLLLAAIIMGTVATVSKQVLGGGHGYNYRETISPWFRSLFYFHPQPELMVGVPWEFQVHVLAGFLVFAVWPYTRLVHAIALPVNYPARPYMVYRSRGTEVGSPGRWQGEWQSATPESSYELKHGDAPRSKKKYTTTFGGGKK